MKLHNWDKVTAERLNPFFTRQAIHSQRLTIARIHLLKGAVVAEHSHEHEQITVLIEGRLRFTVGGEECVLGPGDMLEIQPWEAHRVEALEESVAVDVFCPVREDWIRGEDAYLRQQP